VAQDTTVFVEQGGKTTVTTTVLYASREVRDGILKSGMSRGVAESYDKNVRAVERTRIAVNCSHGSFSTNVAILESEQIDDGEPF
jgi:hypothetical protein